MAKMKASFVCACLDRDLAVVVVWREAPTEKSVKALPIASSAKGI